MSDQLHKRIENQTASLFDEYVQRWLMGHEPEQREFLDRCPDVARAELRDAMDGIDVYFSYYYPRYVSPSLVQDTIEAMRAIKWKKTWMAEVKHRASEVWHLDPENLTHSIAGLINLQFDPELDGQPAMSVPAPLVFKRLGINDQYTHNALIDKVLVRVREQSIPLKVQELLDDLLIDQTPIDLHSVADRLFLHVQEEAFNGPEGCLVTDGQTGVILLNTRTDQVRRRRFTLAHEIGHFVLHRGKQAFHDSRAELSDYSSSTVEIEANMFAAMLLMPPSFLPPGFGRDRPTLSQADELVSRFDVSLEAALRRLVGQSNWRCAFVVSHNGIIKRWTPSLLFDGYIPTNRPPHPATMAHLLLKTPGPDEDGTIMPPHAWVEGSLADENVQLREQSRKLDNGYVYSLISVLDPD